MRPTTTPRQPRKQQAQGTSEVASIYTVRTETPLERPKICITWKIPALGANRRRITPMPRNRNEFDLVYENEGPCGWRTYKRGWAKEREKQRRPRKSTWVMHTKWISRIESKWTSIHTKTKTNKQKNLGTAKSRMGHRKTRKASEGEFLQRPKLEKAIGEPGLQWQQWDGVEALQILKKGTSSFDGLAAAEWGKVLKVHPGLWAWVTPATVLWIANTGKRYTKC